MYKTLIVDDEIWMCEGLKKVIGTYCSDYTVSGVAMNGQQALDILQKEHFHLVITDIRMPKMDGLELLKRMRTDNLQMPVILFTGHNEFEYARTAIRYNVTDYLLKPLDKDELIQVLQKVKDHLIRDNKLTEEASSYSMDEMDSGKRLVEWLRTKALSSYMEDLSITGMAEEAGFNPSYASRLFKEEVGKNFVQFLTETRMEVAQQLLSDSDFSISQVAKKVGFWDVKHFSKTFKKTLGVSPCEYRNDCNVKNTHLKVKM